MDCEPGETEPLLRESRATQRLVLQSAEVRPPPCLRPLLLHEPPILNYDRFEDYPLVQKWIKDSTPGQEHLIWTSAHFDLHTKLLLLGEYREWLDDRRRGVDGAGLEEEEKAFYVGLLRHIRRDRREVEEDMGELKERFGKTDMELEELELRIMIELRQLAERGDG